MFLSRRKRRKQDTLLLYLYFSNLKIGISKNIYHREKHLPKNPIITVGEGNNNKSIKHPCEKICQSRSNIFFLDSSIPRRNINHMHTPGLGKNWKKIGACVWPKVVNYAKRERHEYSRNNRIKD